MTFITIASTPKPFTNPHIATIQWNAIQSWLHLGPEVEVLLVGDEPGMAEVASQAGLQHIKNVELNASGTPLVSSIFQLLRQNSQAPILLFVNADILIPPQVVRVTRSVAEQQSRFLIVGQRWDLDVLQRLDFSPAWEQRLMADCQQRGRLHPPGGSDYFIFPRQCFASMPDFAIGRAGWDNWMCFHARQQGFPLVDASADLPVIHQEHDYSHLPGGQPHYRLPETTENTRLAGGKRAIFTLLDADYRFQDGRLTQIPLRGARLRREIETFPLIKLRSRALGEVFFALFHPRKAWGEWRGRLAYFFSRLKRELS